MYILRNINFGKSSIAKAIIFYHFQRFRKFYGTQALTSFKHTIRLTENKVNTLPFPPPPTKRLLLTKHISTLQLKLQKNCSVITIVLRQYTKTANADTYISFSIPYHLLMEKGFIQANQILLKINSKSTGYLKSTDLI